MAIIESVKVEVISKLGWLSIGFLFLAEALLVVIVEILSTTIVVISA
jgi:hypothetical protein